MHHSLIADKHFQPIQVEFLIQVSDRLFRVTHDLDTKDWIVENVPTGTIRYNGLSYQWTYPIEAIRQFCDDQKLEL